MSERRAGHRSAGSSRRGPDPAMVLVVLVPVVALVAALLLRPDHTAVPDRGPTTTPLAVSSLSCPPAEGATSVSVSSLAEPAAAGSTAVPAGAVTSGIGAQTTLAVVRGQVVSGGAGAEAVVLTGTGDLAPALLATRAVADPLAASVCRGTESDQWFTGVGAAAAHSSLLQLVNPDTGPAVADVTIYSSTGPVDAPALRGVGVAAGQSTTFDLSQVVPRRGDLTLRVQTSRGRLGVSLLDRVVDLGTGAVTADWLPPQGAPARENTLVGLTRGAGARTLEVANPGDGEVVVTIKLITPRSVFAPEGVEPLRVPPQSSSTVSLDDLLGAATARGALGLVLSSTAPVTAGLRQATPDLSLLTPLPAISAPTALVVPAGRARLMLSGATGTGAVTVVASDAAGTELARRDVELAPGGADSSPLPRGTALVTVVPGDVVPGDISWRGAVLVQDPGATVLGLAGLARTSEVPDVRPGLP